ncbi:MAG: flagellar export protein FliJ [Bacillota bacterium]|nr:flagellar export protein FliJ [Bacillota bacterium]
MKFNFSLQKLLNLKVQEEKQELMKLSILQEKFIKAEEVLTSLKDTHDNYSKEIADKKSYSVIELRIYNNYFPVLHRKIDEQLLVCEKCQEQIEKQLEIVSEIIKDRKILEKLKERKYQQALFELSKQEQSNIDEIAVTRFFSAGT